MMQALHSGGLPVVRNERRDHLVAKVNDSQYRMNPSSVYETTYRDRQELDWPRKHDGKAIKVVLTWLCKLAVHKYNVVFMRRNTEEIRQSFEGAFGTRLKISFINGCIKEGLLTLRNRRDVVQLKEVSYEDFVWRPHAYLRWLGWPIDVEAAAAVINPEHYRFRLDKLVIGA